MTEEKSIAKKVIEKDHPKLSEEELNDLPLNKFDSEFQDEIPRRMIFRSARYCNNEGIECTTNIIVDTEKGDVGVLLAQVIKDGGIGNYTKDGFYTFIPYPCAVVEVHKINLEEMDNEHL